MSGIKSTCDDDQQGWYTVVDDPQNTPFPPATEPDKEFDFYIGFARAIGHVDSNTLDVAVNTRGRILFYLNDGDQVWIKMELSSGSGLNFGSRDWKLLTL
ncbi:uncharacterized protein N7498_002753 [Penicillium cinerascens]|uniref:Uncharacterized protein n=1 Tax=Penicillium cinerascens TaxID=70096 RepID=A0A9W9NAS0_9EURO|nr:uncharacterized protein N7498_002753 [Penicillium cinerascens]KAJ5216346.1 hypothetical protein N7498_002753 [Penicillium cinerascens]